MKLLDKMLKSYCEASTALVDDEKMTKSSRRFHDTKKYAFFVEARRKDEDGLIEGEDD